MVPRRAEKNGNAPDPPGAASHAIDLRIDRKVFALHANQEFILLGCAHSTSPLFSPTRPSAPRRASPELTRPPLRTFLPRPSHRLLCNRFPGTRRHRGPAGVPPANGGSRATSSPSCTLISSWAISWFTDTRIFFWYINSPILG